MDVYDILRQLGITHNYCGYRNTVAAVELVLEDEKRLEAVTKEVYYETSLKCGCKWSSVERNIRTAVKRAWSVNPELLKEIAGFPLKRPPTASEFIEIIASYIKRTEEKAESRAGT